MSVLEVAAVPEPLFTIPAAGITNGVLADVLRLEVETDPDGLRNLIVNPDGTLGGYGWVAPVAGTLVRGAVVSDTQVLEFVTASSSVATNYTSELVAAPAGRYIAARWTEQGFSSGTTGYYRARFEFVDAGGALVSSSAQSGYFQNLTPGTVRTLPAVLIPPSATRARLRIDAYSNTSAANPTASRSYRFNAVTVATAATTGELGGTVRTNLVTNPGFTVNTTGWTGSTLTRVDATTLTGIDPTKAAAAGYVCRVSSNSVKQIRESATGTAAHPVTPLATYYVRANVLVKVAVGEGLPDGSTLELEIGPYNGSTSLATVNVATKQVNAAEADAGGWVYLTIDGYYTAPASGVTHALLNLVCSVGVIGAYHADAFLFEQVAAGTTGTRSYFDGATTDADGWVYDWTGTAHASPSTATSTNLDFIPPVPTIDVLGNLNGFKVRRGALEPGTLAAELLDAALDPADGAALIRPGRAVVLKGLTDTGTWRTLYTGTMPKASTTYELVEDVPDEKRARIAVTAHDNLAALAAATRTESVATVPELPYVLEGAGVPWSVNGSGNQVATATVRARDDNATALDQLALTRDTAHGYVWVDRLGIAQAWDADELDATPVLTLDENVYSDAVIDYDTDACINEVQVTRRSINSVGETVEVVTTYTDAASIAEWGRHRAEFVVLAPVNAATFAAEVLAANATPQLRLSACTVNIRSAEFLPVAHLELYDAVTVRNVEKGIDQLARVTGLELEADPEGWMVTLEFSNPSAVASPQVVPPLTPTGNKAAEAYSEAAGIVNVSLSGATTGTAVVTFPAGRFTAAPVVTATPAGSSVFAAYLSTTPTASGVTVGLRDVNATPQNGTWAVHWRATQMTETTGPG